MSKIALEGNSSGTGTFTIAGPNTNTNYTITLPQETGTLVTTGVTTGLNGSAITTGTVATGVGGTGITSVGTAGNVLTSNGTAWVSQAAAAGGGDYIMQVFTTPGTWTKAAGLKAVRVTVIGGGGGAGGAPSPTGPGGTSSFGSPAFLSATGGGGTTSGVGGAGSGGQLNAQGSRNLYVPIACGSPIMYGGASAFGYGVANILVDSPGATFPGAPRGYGVGGAASNAGGGGGGAIEYIDAPALPGPQPYTVGTGGSNPGGTTGGAGVIVVEEFY